jgi:HemY protein
MAGRSADARVARPKARRDTRRTSSILQRWSIVAAIVAATALLLMAAKTIQVIKASRLPTLPQLSGQPAAVREHLQLKAATARQNPMSIDAVGALCLALHSDMFYEQAERCYASAERLDPEAWQWQYSRALILGERGGGDALADALRAVVSKAPRFGPAWWRLGDAEFKLGRADRAEDAWHRAQEAPEPDRLASSPVHTPDVPLNAYASLGLARVALARNDANGAVRILERLVDESPRFGSAFRLLGETLHALDRTREGARATSRADQLPAYAPYADPMIDALALESRNATFLLRQASDADLATNAAWSEHLTRRALEFDPDNPDVLVKLGRLLRVLGRDEEALDYFIAYNKKLPGDAQGLAHIGSCLSDLGRLEEAEAYLRRALEGLDDALTHYNLGVVLATTGRLDEAIAEYRKALDRNPAELNARNNLATALARQGKVSAAVAELREVLARDPENRIALANLTTLGASRRDIPTNRTSR